MRDNSILKEKILQFIERKGVNKSRFYIETGISNGVLSQKNGLSEDNLMRFLNFYTDINPNWLLMGIGEMTKSDNLMVVSEPHTIYGVVPKEESSDFESLRKQLAEERERLRQAHKENGVLEFKLEEAHKEIERLKKGLKNAVSRTDGPELKN